jgi:hypothetical protein
LDGLLKAGLVVEEGNGSGKKLRLPKGTERELPASDAAQAGTLPIMRPLAQNAGMPGF